MGEDRRLPDQPLTMRYLALACSYDETVASDGRIDARLWQALTGIVRDRQGQRVLLVAHGGVVRALERMGGAVPHPIAFLSGRWFSWTQGHLAGREFMAEEPTGRDFEPTAKATDLPDQPAMLQGGPAAGRPAAP
jgi:histidine phosphatase superfamily protein (branch 1)